MLFFSYCFSFLKSCLDFHKTELYDIAYVLAHMYLLIAKVAEQYRSNEVIFHQIHPSVSFSYLFTAQKRASLESLGQNIKVVLSFYKPEKPEGFLVLRGCSDHRSPPPSVEPEGLVSWSSSHMC